MGRPWSARAEVLRGGWRSRPAVAAAAARWRAAGRCPIATWRWRAVLKRPEVGRADGSVQLVETWRALCLKGLWTCMRRWPALPSHLFLFRANCWVPAGAEGSGTCSWSIGSTACGAASPLCAEWRGAGLKKLEIFCILVFDPIGVERLTQRLLQGHVFLLLT